MEENIAPLLESSKQNTSATTKALDHLDKIDDQKKKFKKGNKVSPSVRKKKLNAHLSKILTPKNALTFLNELKPGVIYKVHEYPGVSPPQFVAHIELNNEVLGLGQGSSKAQAKTLAAENAIKDIVTKAISHGLENNLVETDEKMDCDNIDRTAEDLPWAGLASFAIFKMFSEWQSKGADVSITGPTAKHKQKATPKTTVVKEVPSNAAELHPSALLNIMKPGLTATELSRENGPNAGVTMGYTIDGQLYKGFGPNKKDAKKEAAKAALSSLWGVKYT